MIKMSIIVFKLHIIRKKKDFSFRWFTLNLIKFCQFFEILDHSWVACFMKHPVFSLVSIRKLYCPRYGGTVYRTEGGALLSCLAEELIFIIRRAYHYSDSLMMNQLGSKCTIKTSLHGFTSN